MSEESRARKAAPAFAQSFIRHLLTEALTDAQLRTLTVGQLTAIRKLVGTVYVVFQETEESRG